MGSSSPNSPGVFGALRDAIKSTVDYAKPKGLASREARTTINRASRDALDELDGRRRAQSSDHRN